MEILIETSHLEKSSYKTKRVKAPCTVGVLVLTFEVLRLFRGSSNVAVAFSFKELTIDLKTYPRICSGVIDLLFR